MTVEQSLVRASQLLRCTTIALRNYGAALVRTAQTTQTINRGLTLLYNTLKQKRSFDKLCVTQDQVGLYGCRTIIRLCDKTIALHNFCAAQLLRCAN